MAGLTEAKTCAHMMKHRAGVPDDSGLMTERLII